MSIHGWYGNCQSNAGVQGYSDMGGDRSVYPRMVWDYQSNSGVRGYSDIGGEGIGRSVYPIHRWSVECQSNSTPVYWGPLT